MRIRVVSSKDEITELNPTERIVHLAFRPSNVDFLDLMRSCPRLRAVQVPPSYHKTMSKAIKLFLEMQGIDLLEGDVWGHRKDIDEYYVVDEEAIEEIGTLIKQGESIEDASAAIQRKTRLAPDLIKYIAKSKLTA
ncbi:DUF1699 family protein [Methanotrichaceae archaeon M04Ac]|jgi:hypothetical protein|uniref:DUF1699 family protein n=1 Tax=Candidatus Methanocrinis alkalitolerans TaxID=3033395 RepID=A0ABT5XCL4_9EURY|nr:DUF1699 family protein [Candidatus Methanocrinis alkalitolerans]MCR3884691.1 DUF1699 family protein [Methanothrix sp.]MDF0592439.1 DUF1699 family protein [Candidatus Methanocrinis alkalitolerans]